MKTLKYIIEGESIDKAMKDIILSDYKVNADKYDFWNGGVYWNSSLSLDILCDVIMHLIFLGITKASRDLLSLWLKDTNISKKYHDCNRSLLVSISELGLDWCKIITSQSGWVSDNYLGYSRIVKWCYFPVSILRDKDSLEDKYVEPNIPVKHW